jgi:hypothetical protein
MTPITPSKRWAGLLAVVSLMLACSGLGDLLGNSQQATADAFAQQLEMTRLSDALTGTASANATATVRAQSPTPAPTATPLPTSTPDAAATAAAEATLTPIHDALSSYGIDPNQGYLGWASDPKTIELNHYLDTAYDDQFLFVATRNFVVQADVTWTTRTGLAGCGFIFRADQEKNAYAMGIARGAQGVAVFNLVRQGKVANNKWQSQYAPSTNFRNGDTNRLAIVAQETTFSLYVNNQFTLQINDGELQAGAVAFAALSESGTSICTYNNGWLWILD